MSKESLLDWSAWDLACPFERGVDSSVEDSFQKVDQDMYMFIMDVYVYGMFMSASWTSNPSV